MERQRRTATEKQVYYANIISNTLGLEKEFTEEDYFYDVSKFIRDNEKQYKECIEKKATPRQIDYANGISEVIDSGIHFDMNSLREDVEKFIRDNKKEYLKHSADIIYEEKYKSIPNENALRSDKITRDFLIDNLYKKHGIYAFVNDKDEVVYIGKSVDLSQRIPSSFHERQRSANIKQIRFYTEENMSNVDILEIVLIAEYSPVLNCESKRKEKPTMFHSRLDVLKDFHTLPFSFLDEVGNWKNDTIISLDSIKKEQTETNNNIYPYMKVR